MKRVIFLSIIGLGLIGLSGCYTVPRHYNHEVIIYYVPVDPPYPPEPTIDYPPPPPSPPVYYPPTGSNPQRDRLPEKPKDSYQQRDPLQGGSKRGDGTINTVPPVRTPEQKNRGSQ